ncbi:MAG: orotate phosphoribosyltransferase [Chloroflexi bacterium]|nr:MAG: orotate phosphoribosyltransferase [Chloroflexota bacterium]
MERERARLLELLRRRSYEERKVILSSGRRSNFYIDGKQTTLDPEGAYLVGKRVFQLAREAGAEAIGGPTLGADPIVAAAALVSWLEGKPLPAFIVRREPKKHGMQRYIEGHLPPGGQVAIVDDVVTTGGAILRAIEAVEGEGCRVVRVIALLDRQQGGSDELRRRGYDFTPLFLAGPTGEITPGG